MSELLQQAQYFDKYSRYRYDLNRRENWPDTVHRVTDYLFSFDTKNAISDREREEIFEAILDKEVMPSMRNLAMAGEAAKRQNMCSYNCSYMIIEDLKSFYESVIILMSGSGLGYSVEDKHISKLPFVKEQNRDTRQKMFRVQDTTEGWAEAVYYGITEWFNGHDVQFDYVNIRPAGSILKVKGGRASGYEALEESLNKIRDIVLSNQGKQLESLQVHDIMCHIARCIVSGGVRRSAMICLFDKDDSDMIACKDSNNIQGNEQRYLSNNSVAIYSEMTHKEIKGFMTRMFDSYSGEPGIMSKYAVKKTLPEGREYTDDFGFNPSLRKGTLVYTTNGIVPIESLEGKEFKVKNLKGKVSQAECFLSGKNKPLYKLTLKGGHEYYATKEHKWPILQNDGSVVKVETHELEKGYRLPIIKTNDLGVGTHGNYEDGFLAGWITGDGWITIRSDNDKKQYGLILSQEDYDSPIRTILEHKLSVIGCKSTFRERTRGESTWYEINTQSKPLNDWAENFGVFGKKKGLPDTIYTTSSEQFRKGFVDAMISSDGTIDTYNNVRIGLRTAHKNLANEFSELLGFYGLKTSIDKSEINGVFPNGKDYGKTYTSWNVRISAKSHTKHFSNIFSLSHPRKSKALSENVSSPKYDMISDNSIKIASVELTDLKEDVWDISVFDETHCFQLAHCITGNCGEIVLRPYQTCNLSSVICRKEDNFETLLKKVRIATVIGTLQSMSEYFPNLRDEWTQNQIEERLLGVDLNGIMDCPAIQDADSLRVLRKYAREINYQYASRLGINASKAITCIKPSGNASVMLDTSAGIHSRFSQYYIRRIQLHKDNPVLAVLQLNDVPTEPSNFLADTFVASFPVKSPERVKSLSAFEQLENWKKFKVNWTEHNPSCTISYTDDEQNIIVDWLFANQTLISGLSFLPRSNAIYEQMPYEAITEGEYNMYSKDMPLSIDWEVLHELEKEDQTNASQTAGCDGDKCLISF